MQAVKTALAETVAAEASGKKLDATLLGYVAEVALFQLSIKKTILAMKVIDEPTEWAPRVHILPCPATFICHRTHPGHHALELLSASTPKPHPSSKKTH